MNIESVGPAVPAEDGGISYRVKVDGQSVTCRFSAEALEDVDPELTDESPQRQFEASQELLLGIAHNKIRDRKVVDGIVTVFKADL